MWTTYKIFIFRLLEIQDSPCLVFPISFSSECHVPNYLLGLFFFLPINLSLFYIINDTNEDNVRKEIGRILME